MRVKADHLTIGAAYIVGLILIPGHLLQGFSPGHFAACERPVGPDDFGHFLVDALKVTRPDRLIEVNVIVKSVFDRRTVNKLRRRPNAAYRLGHDVRTTMPHHFKTFGIFDGDDLNRRFTADRRGQIH